VRLLATMSHAASIDCLPVKGGVSKDTGAAVPPTVTISVTVRAEDVKTVYDFIACLWAPTSADPAAVASKRKPNKIACLWAPTSADPAAVAPKRKRNKKNRPSALKRRSMNNIKYANLLIQGAKLTANDQTKANLLERAESLLATSSGDSDSDVSDSTKSAYEKLKIKEACQMKTLVRKTAALTDPRPQATNIHSIDTLDDDLRPASVFTDNPKFKTKVLVYAPPGCGKTTTLRKLQQSTKLRVGDTDDPLSDTEYDVVFTNLHHIVPHTDARVMWASWDHATFNQRVRARCTNWQASWYQHMLDNQPKRIIVMSPGDYLSSIIPDIQRAKTGV